jgi:hypothetical protein
LITNNHNFSRSLFCQKRLIIKGGSSYVHPQITYRPDYDCYASDIAGNVGKYQRCGRGWWTRQWSISNYYPGYWWDHTDITIAVQAHPNASSEQLEAIDDAIATWSDVLDRCFHGLITLTNVTGTGNNPQQAADIVVHYVPTAGGVAFGGYAVCGDHGCPNIMVRSDLPPSLNRDPYEPEYLGWVTQHEIGHALGLGHTTNLWESTDLMGYGWPDLGDPVLSECDLEGLAFVFDWVFEGGEPYPPAAGPFECS